MNNEMDLRKMLIERNDLGGRIAIAAAKVARDWLIEHDLEQISVEDENHVPSFASDYDDEVLDMAVGNLDAQVFHNMAISRRGWEPVLRLSDLNAYLARGTE